VSAREPKKLIRFQSFLFIQYYVWFLTFLKRHSLPVFFPTWLVIFLIKI
jgi:hypothetical protein